jgi:hypothetical protein
MNREQLENELREHVDRFPLPRAVSLPLTETQSDRLVAHLLPWIMEMLEEARNEGRTEPLWER